MKILLDTCVWGGARKEMEDAAHEVIWAGDWNEDPGDNEIIARAHSEGRVLVTLDKDFGELAIAHNVPHSGIIRLVDFSARQQAKACLAVIDQYAQELQSGAIITVSPGRMRVRPPGRKEG